MKRLSYNLFAVLFLSWMTGMSVAAVPNSMTYQGRLTDSVGTPLNATVSITFAIYDAETNGNKLWEETQSVIVQNGVFTVALGSVTPFSENIISGPDRYVGIKVGTDVEMIPRQKINSVAFAIKASVADSVAGGAVDSAAIANGSITLEKLADTCSEGQVIVKGASGWQCAFPAASGSAACYQGDFVNCYTGPANTIGVGSCKAGMRVCDISGVFGACAGEVLPSVETCNNIDDDCNGFVDDTSGPPASCYTGPAGTQGVGLCQAGTSSCTGGSLTCSGEVVPASEICDGLDNDCDGSVDEDLSCGSAAINLPKTGQTTSYATGDDGNLQKGVAWPNPRFTTNADTSVTDNLTGLVWVPNADTPTIDTCTGNTKTWQQSLDYVACLNTNNYLGHADWRLPNINELTSLTNAGQSSTAIWLNTQGFSNVQVPWGYWSSTTVRNGTANAWNVVMDGGLVRSNGKGYTSYAWPVRGTTVTGGVPKTGQALCYDTYGGLISCTGTGQDGELQLGTAWPNPRFTTNADTTITDALTGLVWGPNGGTPTITGCIAGLQKTWQNAFEYVACLNSTSYLGHNDWRLPNRNEFDSLVNHSNSYPVTWLIDQGFSDVVQSGWWTSTSSASPATSAWYVLPDGSQFSGDKAVLYHIWPVRGGQ